MATFNNGESLSSVRTKINDAIDKIDGNATISNDITVGGNIAVTGTVDGRDVAADGTKLDGIEASADVTDTANVTAAGALMDSELTSEASVKALDQGVATTDSPTFAGLGVNGTVTADGLTVDGNVASITLNNTDTTIGQQRLGEINFDQNDPDGAGVGTVASMYALNRGASSGFGALVFQTGTASSLADRMRVDYNGDITFFDTSGNASFVYSESTGSTFNENGDNKDFRVESDGQAHMLFVDASTNRVGINNNVPQAFLHVTSGDATPLGSFRVEQTNVSAGGNSWQSLFEDDSSADQGSGNSIIYINSNRPNTSAGKVLRVVGNSKSSEYFSIYDTGEVVVNESSLSTADFRVESDSYSKMLYVDAAIDAVGIGVGNIPNTDKPSVTIGARTIISQVVTNQTLFSDNAYYNGVQWSTLNTDTWAAIRVNGGSLRFHTGQTSHTAGTNLTAMDTTSMRLLLGDSEAVFNDVSQDTDFRVESDSYTHALYVDAGAGGGTGAVGVGTNNPNRKFVVSEEGVNGIELDPNISGESEIISYNRSTNAYTPLNFAASSIELNGVDSGSVIVNQNGNSADFRVESDSDAHALFVDASTNRVGISTSAPPVQFTVGGGDGTAELLLWGDNANSTSSRLIFGAQDPYTSEYIQFRYNSDSNLLQLETDTGFGVGKIVQFDRQYGRVVFNEDSALNADFRVESDASSHAIFSDSNNNVVTFFTSELPIMGSSSLQGVSIGNGGNAEMRILNTTTSPNMWLKKQGTVGNAIAFYKDTASVGTIYVNASSVSYNTTSDYRLKENVVDLTGATERLKQLEPKRFNFITDAATTVDGFLAHEAQAVVPEAVTGTKDEVDADGNAVYQGIDQSKLVPLLVATIKELEARITALENT